MNTASNWAQKTIDPGLPTGRLRVQDSVLEYATWGPAPSIAPTLILLHEGLGCVELWREFPQRLAETTGWGVFAFSRAGYGQSDAVTLPRPLNYMNLEACDVLPSLLERIGVQQHILVGHSDGASIASIYAGQIEDDRLLAIITMAPHYFIEDIALKEIARARDAYENGDLKKGLAKYHVNPDNAFWGWNDSWLNPSFKTWNICDSVDRIRVPVLAIQGVQDQYGTLDQIAVLETRCQSQVETLIVDACQHAPFIDQPNEILARISAFCQQLPATNEPPVHAYVPGLNQRHPEGWFDEIRETAKEGMSIEALQNSRAFQTGLSYIKSGFFWEAHEVLEPVWLALPHNSSERRLVQALIQFANAQLKERMGRPKAAQRLCRIVLDHLREVSAKRAMGIETEPLHDQVLKFEKSIKMRNKAK